MGRPALPKAPAVRFRVDPVYAPEDKIARRLSLTMDQFAECRRRLYARGFPVPDETTGMYDLEAVDRWTAKNQELLAEFGAELSGPSLMEGPIDWQIGEGFPSARTGLVYVVGFGGYVKIGFTATPLEYRLRALQTACPEKLTVHATMSGDMGLERQLHSRFSDLRLNGEWFRREDDLAAWIEKGCLL